MPTIILYIVFVLLPLLIVLAAYLQPFVPPTSLFLDPVMVSDGELHHGFFSNIGVLFFSATAAICLFAGFVLRTVEKTDPSRFLLLIGCFTAWLTLDDFFLLHEHLFVNYVGIPQTLTVTIYMLLLLWIVITFRNEVLEFKLNLFLTSSFFFSISVGVDTFVTGQQEIVSIIEDGAKFLGITTWFAYFVSYALYQFGVPRN